MSKSEWENTPENIEDYQGFVYKIFHIKSNKYYIGKKFYWKAVRRKPLKNKKRVRLDRVESDWQKYWGSSNKFLAFVAQEGEEQFKRVILHNCKTKFDCAYMELQEQMEHNVLFDDDSYNEIINIRLRKPNNTT